MAFLVGYALIQCGVLCTNRLIVLILARDRYQHEVAWVVHVLPLVILVFEQHALPEARYQLQSLDILVYLHQGHLRFENVYHNINYRA